MAGKPKKFSIMADAPLMTEEQAVKIAGKAIASQMVVMMPNPIEFEWTRIVAREFMRRFNALAEMTFSAETQLILDISLDEDKDFNDLLKRFDELRKP